MANDPLVDTFQQIAGALLNSTRFLELEAAAYRERGGEKNIRIADSIDGQIALNNRALEMLSDTPEQVA